MFGRFVDLGIRFHGIDVGAEHFERIDDDGSRAHDGRRDHDDLGSHDDRGSHDDLGGADHHRR